MAGSSSQKRRRSLPERSALLPTETNDERPIPSSRECSSSAIPKPPLWESIPTLPRGGMSEAKVALSIASGAVLITPRQFGPTRRMPLARQISISSRCARAPCSPTSANPAVRTTSARTPSSPQARATSRTPSIGSATIASSTGSGKSATLARAGIP